MFCYAGNSLSNGVQSTVLVLSDVEAGKYNAYVIAHAVFNNSVTVTMSVNSKINGVTLPEIASKTLDVVPDKQLSIIKTTQVIIDNSGNLELTATTTTVPSYMSLSVILAKNSVK
jgi:hypothetical protein